MPRPGQGPHGPQGPSWREADALYDRIVDNRAKLTACDDEGSAGAERRNNLRR